MAWIFLAASADSLAPYDPGSDLSPTVTTIGTLKASCSIVCDGEISRMRQSAMTYVPSLQNLCPSCQILSTEVSRARTSVLRELAAAWRESGAACFSKSYDYAAIYDPDSFSWKTSQLSLFGGSTEFVWNSLRFGMIVA